MNETTATILRNAIITPDGTYLRSYHRHDYREHVDKITGETYIVDGGGDYLRRSINKVPGTDLTVTTDDHFSDQRQAFVWGSYGRHADQPKHYIELRDLTTDHIRAILATQRQIKGTYVEDLMYKELEYRKELNDV